MKAGRFTTAKQTKYTKATAGFLFVRLVFFVVDNLHFDGNA